jgi:predicted NBD/HSP70 family sugar kinase
MSGREPAVNGPIGNGPIGNSPAVNGIATQATVRQINAQTVLEVIEEHHPITRAEVARVTGMTKPTAANALDTLVEAGLVREVDEPPAGRHYASVYFEPDPQVAVVVGIDVDTRHVRGALADLRGEVLDRHDVPIEGEDLVGAFRALRERLAVDQLWSRVVTAVAGVPGLVDAPGGRIWETSVDAWEDLPIAALTEAFGRPLELENDVNLAALGEQWRGSGRGVADFAYLSIGAGVGAGLILDGRLHRGHHGAAGEVDYPDGKPEGRSGTPSEIGLLVSARRRIARWAGPTRLTEPVTAESIFAAFAAGDELADQIVWELARRIARTIAPIAWVVDVDLVVLGGGIAVGHPELVDRVRGLLAGSAPRPPRVTASELGDSASLVGALYVASRTGRTRIVGQRLARVLA